METLARGSALDADHVKATGSVAGAPIVVERGLGECPHGFWYEARQGEIAVLLTVLDPILVAQGDLRARLQREIERTQAVAHRNLLRCFGMDQSGARTYVAEAWPGGSTAREFSRHRAKHRQPIDGTAAYTVIAHVCNAAAALHERGIVHGYITADTVHVSKEGRVLLAGRGIGATLPRSRGFARFRAGGLLPGIAPEQLGTAVGRVAPATDVFALAVLFAELITGKGLQEAGQSVRELGLSEPRSLVDLLNVATSPDVDRRPRDAARFKAALSEALQSAGLRAQTRPPPSLDDAPPSPADPGRPGESRAPSPAVPATANASPGHPPQGYPPPGYPPPGYPPQGYPPQGYPPPAYPPPEYPQAGHPPPGYPPSGYAPPGYPGYAPPGYPGYPPPGYPGYPPPGYPPPGYAGYPQAGPPPPGYPGYPPPGPPGSPTPGQAGGGAVPNAPVSPLSAPSAADLAMAELDRATRRLTASDDDAVFALTTHIDGDDGDAQEDEDEDEEEDDDEDEDESAASEASMLGLRLGGFEEVALRLSTIDGEAHEEASVGPTHSGTYFGNFADPDSRTDLVQVDDDAAFFVVRDDRDYGPYGLPALREMIARGRVRSVDVLRNADTQQKTMTVDLAPLRAACLSHASGQDDSKVALAVVRPPPPALAAARRGGVVARVPSEGRPPWVTALIAVVVLGVGGAGWWLWRSGALG